MVAAHHSQNGAQAWNINAGVSVHHPLLTRHTAVEWFPKIAASKGYRRTIFGRSAFATGAAEVTNGMAAVRTIDHGICHGQ
jgi:hypothetical protein